MGRWAAVCMAIAMAALAGCGPGEFATGTGRELAADQPGDGESAGGFEVLRFNDAGVVDPALSGTVGMRVERAAGRGELTAVTVSVSDAAGMSSVAVNLNYDATAVHPERAEFHELLGDKDHVLSAAFLDSPGTAGLAAAAIRDYDPGPFRGDFATLYFADGPSRAVSAIGDVHSNPYGVGNQFINYITPGPPNLFAEWTDTTAKVSWTTGWHCGDGDQNCEVNAADVVPLALYLNENPEENWQSVVADYDLNGEVNGGDIIRIAAFYGELTNAYLVEAADDDGNGRVEVGLIPWTAKLDSSGGPDGELKSAFDYWEVSFDAASAFTFDQLTVLDADADWLVRVYVTPVTLAGPAVDQSGVQSSIDVEISPIQPWRPYLIITGYDVKLEGAKDGSGGNVFDGDSATTLPSVATIEDANSEVNYGLNAISGIFDGVPFTADELATERGMTQAHYDAALESARENLQWTFSHGGAGGFRRTTDWIELDSGNPNPAPFTIVGDPGGGTVFPDDDPESSSSLAEGALTTVLPKGGWGTYIWTSELHVQVLADLTYDFTVNIEADEAAPELLDYSNDYLPLIVNSPFAIQFSWGSGGDPGTYDNVDLQLVPFDIASPTVPLPGFIDFDYIESRAVNGREFSLDLTGQPAIDCIVPGASLQSSTAYAFRFFDGTTWSSINKPEMLLGTNFK